MGYGEVVGNASVHWTVVHEDERGRETASVRGRDPVRFDDIGGKKKRGVGLAKSAQAKFFFGPKPNFQVRLMYPTKEIAQRAKEGAQIVERDGVFYLVLSVPAVRRKAERVDPPQPPAEIRVDW
jgi:hypothetical protein